MAQLRGPVCQCGPGRDLGYFFPERANFCHQNAVNPSVLPYWPVATGGEGSAPPPWKNLSPPPRLPALTFYRYWGLSPPPGILSAPPPANIPGYGAASVSPSYILLQIIFPKISISIYFKLWRDTWGTPGTLGEHLELLGNTWNSWGTPGTLGEHLELLGIRTCIHTYVYTLFDT